MSHTLTILDIQAKIESQGHLIGTDLSKLDLYAIALSKINLEQANLSQATLTNADLSYANLTGPTAPEVL